MAHPKTAPAPQDADEPVVELTIPNGTAEYEAPALTPIGDVNTPLVTATVLYPPPPGPSYGKTYSTVKLDVEPYTHMEFQIWKNHPMAVEDDFFGVEEERRRAALGAVFLSHNNWHDWDGNPLPPLSDPVAFFRAIPADLFNLMMDAMRTEARRVPDFPKRNSAS